MIRRESMLTVASLLGIASMAVPRSFAEHLISSALSQPARVSWTEPLRTPIDSCDEVKPHTATVSGLVSRSEFELLQRDLAVLRRKMDGIQPASWLINEGLTEDETTTVQPAQYLQATSECCRVPGWVRARCADWMSLGRLQRMTTRIARSGDMDLYMGLNTVGRLQYLQQHDVVDSIGPDGVVPGSLEPGIQTPYGQLVFLADFNREIEVYFDIFIASRPHEDTMQGDEGFILFRRLPGPLGDCDLASAAFEMVNVKVGEFEMDFGDAHYRRSNNADVQRNPLIGNYVIDPRGTDIGFEMFSPRGSLPINWLVGVGVGNTGDLQADRGWQTHAKVWAETAGRLRPSISFFRADHSGNSAGFPNSGSKSDLFRSNRAGGPYADILGAGNAPGQVTPGNGQLVTAGQFDLTWIGPSWEFYGHVGMVEDADTNGSAAGSPAESWFYYAGESVFYCTPRSYLAARYTGASARHLVSSADPTRDVTSDGFVHRFQLGGGYWLHDLILAKLEYVHQFYEGFRADGSQVSGVDVWQNPRFDGVLMEVSLTF